MDQLKPYLVAIRKHHFWILLGALIITSSVVWYSAAGELDQKFTQDKQRNESAFRQMMPLRNDMQTNSPPNPEYKKAVDKTREKLAEGVYDAWKLLFTEQMGVLTVNDRVPEMVKFLIDEKHFKDEIPAPIRNVFHNNEVIEDDFRKLFVILNLRRPNGVNPVDEGGGGPAAQPKEGPPEGVLLWNAKPAPRGMMLRYKTINVPSTSRIRMLQEDLWVFRSMFKVIAKINSMPIDVWLQVMEGGAPPTPLPIVDQANVPIKQINYCDLAQYATSMAIVAPGRVNIGEDDDQRAAAGLDASGSGFTVGTQGNEEEDRKLREGRYIDGRNQPVLDPATPPFTEFKQIFVQMTVIMDQRFIPALVAESANAELTIETRQVLVDLSQVDVLRRGDAAAGAQQAQRIEQSPHDVIVTVRGVVYGYSPPDKSKLGTGSDPEPSKRDYGIPSKLGEQAAF
jgi:hypothetical protein